MYIILVEYIAMTFSDRKNCTFSLAFRQSKLLKESGLPVSGV